MGGGVIVKVKELKDKKNLNGNRWQQQNLKHHRQNQHLRKVFIGGGEKELIKKKKKKKRKVFIGDEEIHTQQAYREKGKAEGSLGKPKLPGSSGGRGL